MIQKEIWRPVKGYQGMYRVSNLGIVMSLHKQRLIEKFGTSFLKVYETPSGDKTVELKQGFVRIDKLVAEAFCDNPCGYKSVRHKNGNKADNRTCNLEWVDEQPALSFESEPPITKLLAVLIHISNAEKALAEACRQDSEVSSEVKADHLNKMKLEITNYFGRNLKI